MKTLNDLIVTMPQTGRVEWIGLRPARRAAVKVVSTARAIAGSGLEGDRYASRDGNRQVTLISAEHLEAVASMLGRERVLPQDVRRNIVVRGINLLALKDKSFSVGSAVLEYTGLCQPCSLMETTLGPGGYNAMRGHGGITARVIQSGQLSTDDPVKPVD